MNLRQQLSRLLNSTFPMQSTRPVSPTLRRGNRGCTGMLRHVGSSHLLAICALDRGHAGDHAASVPGEWEQV